MFSAFDQTTCDNMQPNVRQMLHVLFEKSRLLCSDYFDASRCIFGGLYLKRIAGVSNVNNRDYRTKGFCLIFKSFIDYNSINSNLGFGHQMAQYNIQEIFYRDFGRFGVVSLEDLSLYRSSKMGTHFH